VLPNSPEFDAVNTFAIVRLVVTMYERALREVNPNFKLKWAWDSPDYIEVHPRAGVDQNAYYSRDEKALKFFFFDPQEEHMFDKVYTCRSLDIVAHETGHAVLDALKPGLLSSDLAQSAGFHESFGDISAILCLLSQLDVCEAIIAETKGNLRSQNFFEGLAEQFGKELGKGRALRHANNQLTLQDVDPGEPHDLSQVFTGAFYDLLVAFFDDSKNYDLFNPAETIYKIGKYLGPMLLYAIHKAPESQVSYANIAEKMIEYAQVNSWVDSWIQVMHKVFEARLILGPQRVTRLAPLPASGLKIKCQTLKRGIEKIKISG
jgi:hypothetical protein